ncbi:DUF1206 domain-containing protein [Streptomyces sp. NPDC002004]
MNAQAMAGGFKSKAWRARRSSWIKWAARSGFAARGVIYVLVGILAVEVARGDGHGKQADRGGALAEIAGQPFGLVVLWCLAVGLWGMAVWRLSEAVLGATGAQGDKASGRALSAARCVFYGFVAWSVTLFAAGDRGSGSGSSDKQSHDVTATALSLPAGQWLVGAAGAGVVCAGLWIAGRAMLRSYREDLKVGEMPVRSRRIVDVLGVSGGVARGAVFAAAGGFAVRAAVTYDPDRAKGFDDTLRSFADTPAGPSLLVAVAVGLALFGLFSFAVARWRRV